MSEFYKEMQGVASDVLEEFNQGEIALIETVKGSGPAHNPGPSTNVRHVIPGAVARGASFKYVQQGLASAGDMEITMRADGIVPKQGMSVDIDGVVYKVNETQAIPAAGTPAVYKVFARK